MGQGNACPGGWGPRASMGPARQGTLGTQGLQTRSRMTRAPGQVLPLEKSVAEGFCIHSFSGSFPPLHRNFSIISQGEGRRRAQTCITGWYHGLR